MSYLIRSAQEKDFLELLRLSQTFPLSNLPRTKKLLKEKIHISGQSFKRTLTAKKRNYLFVLEDKKTNKLAGTSQILSFFGENRSYCYRLEKKPKAHLKFTQMKRGRNQLGGLVLDSKYRSSPEKLGFQIAACRFLYIQIYPKDFSKTLEVCLTAPFQNKNNPFWKDTMERHSKINYLKASKLYREKLDEFVNMFPKNLKIPLSKLSPLAQFCLSHVHPKTQPVYKGLIQRGFKPSSYHHLLDGGMYLESQRAELLKKSRFFNLKFSSSIKGEPVLIAQETKKGFFCLKIKAEKQGRFLKIPKNSFLEEDKKAIAIDF